jgi:limonene 1,2-monooxygenase
MHIAETREQAAQDAAFGLPDWIHYFQEVAALPLAPDTKDPAEMVAAINASGVGVIGTPDDAIGQLRRLEEQSGGFGAYLVMANEWADRAQTLRSYELFARHVMPEFQGTADRAVASRDWAGRNRPQFIGEATNAIMAQFERHAQEKNEG